MALTVREHAEAAAWQGHRIIHAARVGDRPGVHIGVIARSMHLAVIEGCLVGDARNGAAFDECQPPRRRAA